ncbi:MAG: FmdB family transcriptional regulator [Actinomycetota bacterium]
MPTYVYKFIDTGETIEIYQAFSDDALTEASHPSDGKPRPVKKVFTPVGVTFKGGGFYKNDSAASSKSGASSNSATSTSGTASTSAGTSSSEGSSTSSGEKSANKTETKTETKTESKSETKTSPAKSE